MTATTSIRDLPDGLHPGLHSDVYHAPALGVVSKSALDELDRSPAHYRAWVDGLEAPATPALVFGAAFHCALLEPERFRVAYATEPDFGDCRKKDNKAARDEWRKAHEGAIALSEEDQATIVRMVNAVAAHPLAGRMLRDGEPELTVRWTDKDTGLSCKLRADYHVRRLRMGADIKSTLDASPGEFRRDVARYHYHWQDAHYRSGFAAVGEDLEHFAFIAVEKTPPHAIAVYTLDRDGLVRGMRQVQRLMGVMAECLKKNEWPGYPVTIQTLDLPPWAA